MLTRTQKDNRSAEYKNRFKNEVYDVCNIDAADGAPDSFVVLSNKLWAECTKKYNA